MSFEHRKEYMQAFDMSKTKNRWSVPTLGAETFNASAEAVTSWSSGTLNVYRSNDGVTGYALEETMQFTGAGMMSQTDCSGFPWLVFETGSTESCFINITVNFARSLP